MISSLSDAYLRSLMADLLELQLSSKSKVDSTLQRYKSGWLWWWQWATSKIGVPVIPAKLLHVALFLTELCKTAVQAGSAGSENSVIESSDRISVLTPKIKSDQFREGHTSSLAKSGKVTCTVVITEKLVKLLLTSNYSRLSLVRRIVNFGSKTEYFHTYSCRGRCRIQH